MIDLNYIGEFCILIFMLLSTLVNQLALWFDESVLGARLSQYPVPSVTSRHVEAGCSVQHVCEYKGGEGGRRPTYIPSSTCGTMGVESNKCKNASTTRRFIIFVIYPHHYTYHTILIIFIHT